MAVFIEDHSWYDKHGSETLKKMAMRNPEFVEEFRKRALIDRDFKYLREFWAKLREESRSDNSEQSTD